MATVKCIQCGRRVPFVLGYPSPELLEQAERGEVVLGGCLIPNSPPRDWVCPSCDADPTDEAPSADRDTPGPPADHTVDSVREKEGALVRANHTMP